MSHTVYLDESGDLGFKFTKPYGAGGSSRRLTIAFIVVPDSKNKQLKRLVRKVYKKYGFVPGSEAKASSITEEVKMFIANQIVDLVKNHPEVKICSITVNKENVQEHIRQDPNKLYNYMMRLAVLDRIKHLDKVLLLRDDRSVKVASGNSLIDYLQTTLWFEMSSKTVLTDLPSDSKKFLNLILTDWINNIVWHHYENGNSNPYNVLIKTINCKQLFF